MIIYIKKKKKKKKNFRIKTTTFGLKNVKNSLKNVWFDVRIKLLKIILDVRKK